MVVVVGAYTDYGLKIRRRFRGEMRKRGKVDFSISSLNEQIQLRHSGRDVNGSVGDGWGQRVGVGTDRYHSLNLAGVFTTLPDRVRGVTGMVGPLSLSSSCGVSGKKEASR